LRQLLWEPQQLPTIIEPRGHYLKLIGFMGLGAAIEASGYLRALIDTSTAPEVKSSRGSAVEHRHQIAIE
jgi:hypothetical protein